ncbi:hypothetical protein [Phaeovulum sp. NW3]|uniref:hypothetical protein n=1 Tax=Phaeovulum sp. NW3 TaxID=2934933 RepID=UPI002021768D|nr:hypothetical protein [Phaeovulum sp. NW3]MCL7466794.1 hypothetical protein [Phaeovulum sp. NW3]
MARKPSSKLDLKAAAAATPVRLPRTIADPALELQLLEELKPRTRYERLVAENIVANEVRTLQLRRHRDAILRHYAGDKIATRIKRAVPAFPDERVVDLVRAWVRGSEEVSRTLEELGIDEERVLTDVFVAWIDTLSTVEKELALLERRRARLRKEYRELKAERAETGPIEDAEVVE